MKNSRLEKWIAAALFAALTAVFSQIALPLPFTPTPINLATLSVFLAGGLLGAKYGSLSQLLYLLLGLIGLPVFSGFSGGPAVLFGPTGGYIAGYVLCAFVCGLLLQKQSKQKSEQGRGFSAALSLACGLSACYLPGTLWFMFQTGSGIAASLVMCVFPFLPGDALKIAAAVLLIRRLRRALPNL